MNFLSMKYFMTAARERNFTRAAQQLHITQQTLSTHIASLEQELGCTLFIRHVPLELTYAGEVFLRYAGEFDRNYRSLKQEFSDIVSEEQGILRIGVANTRGHTIMPDLITEFQKVCPKIEILLAEATNEVLQQRLAKQELDLAVALFPESLPDVELKDFYEEEVLLLVSKQLMEELYGTDAEAISSRIHESGDLSLLAACPFLLDCQEDILGRISHRLIREAGFLPKVRVQSSNLETLLSLCAKGGGACFCSDRLLKTSLTEEELRSMHLFHFGKNEKYMIRFGWPRQHHTWNVVSQFIETASRLIH